MNFFLKALPDRFFPQGLSRPSDQAFAPPGAPLELRGGALHLGAACDCDQQPLLRKDLACALAASSKRSIRPLPGVERGSASPV